MTKDSLDPRLVDLLVQWEQRRSTGESITPEEFCRAAPELLEPFKQQLAALERADGFLRSSAETADSWATAPAEPTAKPGSQPGRDTPASAVDMHVRYQDLRFHAQGGMGEVWQATDADLGRRVALKLIQERYAGDVQAKQRFLVEAEVTSKLDHPGIAPVHSAGQMPDGRPCYSMRFIQGESLREAIRRFHKIASADCADSADKDAPGSFQSAKSADRFSSLPFRELLQRFIAVCNTIAYAHSRGVIHRDLKPANIMLGKYGETLVVDWGLARLVERDETARATTEETLKPSSTDDDGSTRTGLAKGTPAYMSPEQAAGNWDTVHYATDIYSLGTTLYELLTGRLPFGGDSWPDMQQKIQRGDFARPRHIHRSVPPALEAVCLKAMALKAEYRYRSAEELAVELELWLGDEAVRAYTEPLAVRVRRWGRRHRSLVTGGAAALLVSLAALLVGLIVVARLAEKERQAKDVAQTRLAQVEKSGEILDSIFKDLHPQAAEKEGVTLRVILGRRLDQATAQLDAEAIGDPLTVARLQNSLAVSQLGLGYPDKALILLQKAYQTRSDLLDPDHTDTLTTMYSLAQSFYALGRHGDALKLCRELVARNRSTLGVDHRATLASMDIMANNYAALGQHAEARKLRDETLALKKLKLGLTHIDTLGGMVNLANSYQDEGQTAEAVELYKEALRLLKAKVPDHEYTVNCTSNLGISYALLNRHADALKLFEETLALRKVKLGLNHSATLESMNGVANSYFYLRRFAEALKLHEEILELRKAKQGNDHPQTLRSVDNVAGCYTSLGQHDKALSLRQANLVLMKAKLGPDHPDTLVGMGNLVLSLVKLNRSAEAIPIIDECVRRAEGKAVHPQIIPMVLEFRLRHFEKAIDAAGCRTSAEMWERLNRSDPRSLYNAACIRAVTAAVVMREPKTSAGETATLAKDEADQAMAWLKKAVAAGYRSMATLQKDKDLDALREREDFKELLAELATTKDTKKVEKK